jgi:hypothetical protein
LMRGQYSKVEHIIHPVFAPCGLRHTAGEGGSRGRPGKAGPGGPKGSSPYAGGGAMTGAAAGTSPAGKQRDGRSGSVTARLHLTAKRSILPA